MKSPAFQYYPADFLSDHNVLVMTAAEVGAYWLLLSVCWQQESLPDDIDLLSAIARLPRPQFIKAWETKIRRCFTQREDSRWIHKRLEREREKQEAWRLQSIKGGKRSARSSKHHKVRGLGGKFSTEPSPNHNRSGLAEPQPNSSSSFSSSSSFISKDVKTTSADAPFSSPAFLETLSDFERYRKEIGKTLRPTGRRALYSKLTSFGESDAIRALRQSIASCLPTTCVVARRNPLDG